MYAYIDICWYILNTSIFRVHNITQASYATKITTRRKDTQVDMDSVGVASDGSLATL